MDTKRTAPKQPVRTMYFHVSTTLAAVLAGILLSLPMASITRAQTFPPDQIEPPAESAGWKYTELVSKNSSDHGFSPDIVTGSGGRQFVAWVETVANTVNRKLLFSQRAAGYGQSWSTPTLITEIALEGGWYEKPCPSLAAGGSDLVHIVWTVNRTDSAGGIFYRKYNSQTEAWESATQVVSGMTMGCPKLVANANDNLHLVWAQSDGVYYRAFDKNLNAWLEAVRLSQTADTYSEPGLAVGGDGSVHVAWVAGPGGRESTLYYRNRKPGVPWSEVQSIAATKPAANCTSSTFWRDYPAYVRPGVAADKDGNVHLAWTQMICRLISVNNVDEAHILYKRYSESTGWTADETISGPRPEGKADRHSTAPSLAITRSSLYSLLPASLGQRLTLHVVWREKTHVWLGSYKNLLWYRNYDSTSGAWSESYEVQKFDEPLDGGRFIEFSRPAVSVDSSKFRGVTVHTTWTYQTDLLDSGTDIDVFYRRYVHTTALVIKRTAIYLAIIALGGIGAIYGYRRYRSRREVP